MGLVKLIATKRLRYGTRAFAAGDRFEVPERDAKLLVYAVKRAKFAKATEALHYPAKAPAKYAEPEPAKAAPTPADLEVDRLRNTARRLGLAVDHRWGAARLRSEITAFKKNQGPV